MRIDIRKKKHAGYAKDFKVFDSDTGKEISKVVWADVAKGEYGQIRTNPDGSIFHISGMTELEVLTRKGNIELRSR